jgi:hypothetical protein
MSVSKILVATPCAHDIVDSHYASTIFYVATMLARAGIDADVVIMGSSDLEQSRSMLASVAIADRTYTHLLFIDSDMCFHAKLVQRMIEFDQQFVSAIYPMRQLDLAGALKGAQQDANFRLSKSLGYVGRLKTEDSSQGEGKLDIQITRGFAQAEHTGMGACLLHRSVLEEMIKPGVVAKGRDGGPAPRSPILVPYYGFFHKERASPTEIWGEDYSFCRRWTQGCGGIIWACVDEEIVHRGMFKYSGVYLEKLKAGDL